MKQVYLLLLLLPYIHTESENNYFNTKNLCTLCSCYTKAKNYILDCTNKNIPLTIANWPEKEQEDIQTIKAVFTRNAINRLDALPPTDNEVIVYFDHCSINELGSGLFENCPGVTFVDLSYNFIKSDQLHSDVFKGPYNDTSFEPLKLRQLDLSYNDLHTLNQDSFEHLPELRWLNLEGNGINVIDKHTELAFTNIQKLEYLNLANNGLTSFLDSTTKLFPNLRILDLSRNEFELIPEAILVLKKLQEFKIDGNPIVELTDESFVGMTELIVLSATDLKEIDEIKPNSFVSLKNLQKLDLSGLEINFGINEESFKGVDNLIELNLSSTNLHELPKNLVDWSKLKVLDIRHGMFYCVCDLMDVVEILPDAIKEERNGPFCYDAKRYAQYEIYTLSRDICFEGDNYKIFPTHASAMSDMRILRMSILMLSIMCVVAAVIALWLGYTKYINNRRNYTFATSVVYNPIATNF